MRKMFNVLDEFDMKTRIMKIYNNLVEEFNELMREEKEWFGTIRAFINKSTGRRDKNKKRKDIGMIKLKIHFYNEEKREYRMRIKDIESYVFNKYEKGQYKEGNISGKLMKIEKNIKKMKMNKNCISNIIDSDEIITGLNNMIMEVEENNTNNYFIPIEEQTEDDSNSMYISAESTD